MSFLAALGAYQPSVRYGPESREIDADAVAPRLWVGAAPYAEWVNDSDFDMVVLAAEEWQPRGFAKGVKVVRVPLDDDRLDPRRGARVLTAAFAVNEMLRRGGKVLVTCWQGKNRSGLIAATALLIWRATRPGYAPAREVVAQIRRRRRGALQNPWYERFVLKIMPAAFDWWDEHAGSRGSGPLFPPGLDWGEGLHW